MKSGILIVSCIIFSMTAYNVGLRAKERHGIKVSCPIFQIVTDKTTYSGGEWLHLKLIVTNNGESSLYVSREMGFCSGPTGFAVVEILDQFDRQHGRLGCSADGAPETDAELLELMGNSKFWIQLRPGEVYGQELRYELPLGQGTYRIRANLLPAGFSDKQSALLLQKGIHVLGSSCSAAEVTISVR
jgi:hypothetical protein